MDFQGQGTALTGETEALALIDPTSRYVVIIPLMNREAQTWLQPFLDRIVFTFGAPSTLHSDAAPEFLSEALTLLAQAAGIKTTTTLGHNARGNGTIEVFWRFWNRCLRILSDDHYVRWPSFAQRIAFAFNTMAQIGRRAKHITAWRGPCTVVERLSSTAYAVVDDTTQRRFERVASNILPYRASQPKANATAQSFNEIYSEPLREEEFIAIRDEPTGPFYVAQILEVTAKEICVQYFGTTQMVLKDAIFKPCWHEVAGDSILLSWKIPAYENCVAFIEYSGNVELKDVHTVLVARNLEFTKTGRLRFHSLRALAPFHDQLFRFVE
jgi:hypothetical protein